MDRSLAPSELFPLLHRVERARGTHFNHSWMGGGESKQEEIVQAPEPTPEPIAAPTPKSEPKEAKMSEPTAAPELKEYPEFPGEKLSKRCVHQLCDRGPMGCASARDGRRWTRVCRRGRSMSRHEGLMDPWMPSTRP